MPEELASRRILIVDDISQNIKVLGEALRGEYTISFAKDGRRAIELAGSETPPDLILLDIMMPDMDGWEVCRRLRELSDVPIIFLTAKDDVRDVVKGLELGGDDYIIKPYNSDELVARIKAHLRRSPKPSVAEELVFDTGNFRINFISREVRVRGKPVHLTPKEFNLLGVLARNAGRVLDRTELVREAWGPEYGDAIDSLKLYIHYLRQKIEKDPQQPAYILTSRGVGYRFNDV